MPLPGRSPMCAASQASRARSDGSRSTPSRSESLESGPRPVVPSTPPAPSCSATSATTRSLAVAVVASTGVPAGSWPSRSRMRREWGRKSWPQSETQCASSTTSRPQRLTRSGSCSSRNRGLVSRSGDTSRTSTSSGASRAGTSSHSVMLALEISTARMPARAAAATWSRISASSGLTSRVGPAPRRRRSAVDTKYTADFPQPVRWTTRARCERSTSAATAASCPSRKTASGRPVSSRSTPSASVVRSDVGATVLMPTTVGSSTDRPARRARPEDDGGESSAMRPSDNHVHTRWSWDTPDSSTMRKACERAIAQGLPAIAFTEHLDFTDWLENDAATAQGLVDRHPAHQLPIDVEGYFAEIAECRERFPELRIWSGVEAGEPHLFAASIAAHLRDSPVDRVLGSLHSLDLDGRLVGVGRLLYTDADTTMRRYLGELVGMIENSQVFQVLAHVDFPRRYWPGGTQRYLEKDYEEEYRAVFRALASTGRALEINTSSPLASADQVRWFHEEGGEAVSFGSDAHAPTAVGQKFDLAVDVAEAAGFRPGRDRFDFWRR